MPPELYFIGSAVFHSSAPRSRCSCSREWSHWEFAWLRIASAGVVLVVCGVAMHREA